MSFVPSTAAQNTATLAGSNQAALASPLTSLQTSITGGNLAPAALIDAILSSVGYQAQDVSGPGAQTSTGSFANVFPSYTFNAPIAKKYLVHIDVTVSATVLTAGRASMSFQLLVNGATVVPLNTGVIDMISTVNYWSASWRAPVTMNTGNNTLQLQWAANTGTASSGGGGNRIFTITG